MMTLIRALRLCSTLSAVPSPKVSKNVKQKKLTLKLQVKAKLPKLLVNAPARLVPKRKKWLNPLKKKLQNNIIQFQNRNEEYEVTLKRINFMSNLILLKKR